MAEVVGIIRDGLAAKIVAERVFFDDDGRARTAPHAAVAAALLRAAVVVAADEWEHKIVTRTPPPDYGSDDCKRAGMAETLADIGIAVFGVPLTIELFEQAAAQTKRLAT